jgi:hypothetical protein
MRPWPAGLPGTAYRKYRLQEKEESQMHKSGEVMSGFAILALVLTMPTVASAVTYDFTDNPLLHKAYEGYDDQRPADSPPDFEEEMGAAEYADISASDDSRAWFSESDKYEFHRFVFKIDEPASAITQIAVLHEGYGAKGSGPGHTLYIWNYATPGWEYVNEATTVGTPDQVLTGTLTSDLSDYVESGELQLLVVTNHDASCPFLYTWDGIGYRFVADINSNGGFGFPDPTTEERALQQPYSEDYTKIDGAQLVARDGMYRLEIAEEQNEITYLDGVRLLAVDHSPDVEVYSPVTNWVNDVPPFQIHTIKDPVVPVSATDANGVNILPVISAVDRECTEAQPFHFDTVTVDFGDLSGAKQIKMLYNAWVDWPGRPEAAAREEYLSSHPDEWYAYMSYAEVINEDGEWQRVSDEEHLGRPQAKPRTMVLDITDWFVTDDYRVRINNWLDTHIDYIAVDVSEDEDVSVAELAPVSADLYWKGVSVQSSPDRKEPSIPDYYDVADLTGFSFYEGQFTRYGDVLPLLDQVDDKYVIMHAGDSIAIGFDGLSIPDGMERDYYLFSDGYYNQSFVKWLLGQEVSSVDPLPFHGMSNYPYPDGESYPYDAEHVAYLQEYNTREFGGSPDTSGHHSILTDYVKVDISTAPFVGANLITDGGDNPTDIGDLAVSYSETGPGDTNDGKFTVAYSIDSPWEIVETHVYIGSSAPKKHAPGRFPYKEGVISFDADAGVPVYIAAHAEVRRWIPPVGETPGYWYYETVWAQTGDDVLFRSTGKGNKWATYFSWTPIAP